MAGKRWKLTDRLCASAKVQAKPGKPTPKQFDYFDETIPGLALRVTRHGIKAWTLVYTRPDGRRARITLGRYPTLSLAGARTQALEAKAAIANGADPRPTAALPSGQLSRNISGVRALAYGRAVLQFGGRCSIA
jgi:Arm DNA-binding domain